LLLKNQRLAILPEKFTDCQFSSSTNYSYGIK